MTTKRYTVSVRVLLRTVNNPRCRITVMGQTKDLTANGDTWVEFILEGHGAGTLNIEHYDKRDSDPTTALIIEQIQFNEITDPKFIWAGVYRPNYPTHLTGAPELKYHNYLGWNGVWSLEFTLPIYTWIHKILDLGWIYD